MDKLYLRAIGLTLVEYLNEIQATASSLETICEWMDSENPLRGSLMTRAGKIHDTLNDIDNNVIDDLRKLCK